MSGDNYYANVVLLLPMRGANGSTVFPDYAQTRKTVSVFGNARISTAQSRFGGSSGYFDGSGDYLTIPNSADFAFGAGDFTIEGWVYVSGTTGTNQEVLSYWSNSTGWAWELYIANGEQTAVFNINGAGLLAGSITSFTGGWHHLAVTRNSTTWRLFIDGVLKHTVTSSASINSTGAYLSIGAVSAPVTWYFKGYMADLRITKGVARYTSAFTPPAASFVGVLSGTVKDAAAAPLARSVRAYRRSDGVLIGNALSDAGSGAFALDAPIIPHQVVVLGDAAQQQNALIFDDVLPALVA